jgi:hypothetical protein
MSIQRKVEDLPEIKSGLTWSTDKKVYTVIECIENSVQYVVNKPGKSAKIKNKHIDKVVNMLLNAETIFAKGKNETSVPHITGIFINTEELILRDLPLEQPLSNGMETIYCFSLDSEKGKLLIGASRTDTNPTWMDVQDVFKIMDGNFLQGISQHKVDLGNDLDEDVIRKKALQEIKKLKNK